MSLCYPAYALTYTFSAVLRSTERVRLPMFVSLLTTIENIVLNYILIFGKFGAPALGVAGAANDGHFGLDRYNRNLGYIHRGEKHSARAFA